MGPAEKRLLARNAYTSKAQAPRGPVRGFLTEVADRGEEFTIIDLITGD